MLATHKDLALKIEALEGKYQQHDETIKEIFDAIRELMTPDPVPPTRRIGFNTDN